MPASQVIPDYGFDVYGQVDAPRKIAPAGEVYVDGKLISEAVIVSKLVKVTGSGQVVTYAPGEFIDDRKARAKRERDRVSAAKRRAKAKAAKKVEAEKPKPKKKAAAKPAAKKRKGLARLRKGKKK